MHFWVLISCVQFVAKDSACDARSRGGGVMQVAFFLRGGDRGVILARDLLRQAEAQSQVPVQFPVP